MSNYSIVELINSQRNNGNSQSSLQTQQIKNFMYQVQGCKSEQEMLQKIIAQNPEVQGMLNILQQKGISLQQFAQIIAQRKGINLNNLIQELLN